jgi:L-methionine (R)-S-oxide reductase
LFEKGLTLNDEYTETQGEPKLGELIVIPSCVVFTQRSKGAKPQSFLCALIIFAALREIKVPYVNIGGTQYIKEHKVHFSCLFVPVRPSLPVCRQAGLWLRGLRRETTEQWSQLAIIYLCFMSEDLQIITGNRTEQYESIIPQIRGLLTGEPDLIANLANVVAALKEQFGWLWIGFYLVKNNELVLSPFQGPVACTRIRKGKGVCGTSWEKKQALIVPDVEKFPGHIACSSLSRSEIVIPVVRNNEVVAVLDVDSSELASFDNTDQHYLQKIVDLIEF